MNDRPHDRKQNIIGTTTRGIREKLISYKDEILSYSSGNLLNLGTDSTAKTTANKVPNFTLLERTILPFKNHLARLCENKGKNDSKSFHEVDKRERKGKIYYHKHNPPGSWMSVLEAFGAGVCRKIAGSRYIPKAYATFNDEQQYDGVDSKALDGFKSVGDDPLKMADLKIDLQGLDYDKRHPESLYKFIGDLDKLDEEQRRAEREGATFELDQNLENYRIVKALAICLITSYIFEEDDLHRDNLSKRGRIDFDMILWPILFHFKKGGLFDSYLRSPSRPGWFRWWKWFMSPQPENRFNITAKDIRNFPNLKDADPFYWPTKASTIQFFGYWLASKTSKNDFDAEEIKAYKALKNHPVFIYHKYATLLKFLLTDPSEYQKVAEAHIPKDFIPDDPQFGGKSLIDILVNHISSRIEEFRKVLVEMPEFCNFVISQGDVIFEKMEAEIDEQNSRLAEKIARLEAELLEPEKVEIRKEEVVPIHSERSRDEEKREGVLHEWEMVEEEKPQLPPAPLANEWEIVEEEKPQLPPAPLANEWEMVEEEKPQPPPPPPPVSREEKLAKIAAYKNQIIKKEQIIVLREKYGSLKTDCYSCTVTVKEDLSGNVKDDYGSESSDSIPSSPVQNRSPSNSREKTPPSSPRGSPSLRRGGYGTFS